MTSENHDKKSTLLKFTVLLIRDYGKQLFFYVWQENLQSWEFTENEFLHKYFPKISKNDFLWLFRTECFEFRSKSTNMHIFMQVVLSINWPCQGCDGYSSKYFCWCCIFIYLFTFFAFDFVGFFTYVLQCFTFWFQVSSYDKKILLTCFSGQLITITLNLTLRFKNISWKYQISLILASYFLGLRFT